LGLTLFNGTRRRLTWGYLARLSTQALAYPGAAMSARPITARLGRQHRHAQFRGTGPLFAHRRQWLDADPAQVIADFLLNPQYGVGFPGASIDATTLYGSGATPPCRAIAARWALLQPVAQSDRKRVERADALAAAVEHTAVWSGDRLRFIPYGDAT